MNSFTFTVLLDHVPDDAGEDRLYEAGLDDGNVTVSGDGTRASIIVTREAESLDEAIIGVLVNIRSAGFQPTGIENEDLVTITTIARRTNRTYESIRLLVNGKRGPGGFPRPVTDGLYSWSAVRRWFASYGGETASLDTDDDTLAAADMLLRARLLRPNLDRLAELVTI